MSNQPDPPWQGPVGWSGMPEQQTLDDESIENGQDFPPESFQYDQPHQLPTGRLGSSHPKNFIAPVDNAAWPSSEHIDTSVSMRQTGMST